jgi:hypothetical protein
MNTKLPKAFKRKWVNALRSGKYTQGTSQLYSRNGQSYCCLGVACAVAGLDKDEFSGLSFIPDKIGFNDVPTLLRGGDEGTTPNKLAIFNDDKKRSFKWIASYIERYL